MATLTAQAGKFVLQLSSTAVLARLLTPGDFGLVAMVAAFTGFVGLFKDLGLSMATVQRQDITHAQVSALFWINIGLSTLLAAIGVACAPAVAWFYGEPRLVWVTIAISSTFLFGGLAAQHTALLRRQMRFATLASVEVSSLLCAVVAAAFMAFLGFSYWALVGMTATHGISTAAGVWLASGWCPSLPRRADGIVPMLKFGGNLTGFSALNYIARNADNVLIGRWWGAAAVGLYGKAYGLLMLPIQQINAPVGAVIVPALSRLQDQPERFKAAYCQAATLLAYVTTPLVVLCAVLAEDIVLVVLGSQWAGAATLFRWLAIAALGQPIVSSLGWIYISLGKTGRMLRWGLISSITVLTGFGVGVHWGPVGVAIGYAATTQVLRPFALYYATRESPLRPVDVLRATWRPFVLSLMLGVAAVSVRTTMFHAGAISALTSMGIALVVTACIALTWSGARSDIWSIVRMLRSATAGSRAGR